MARIEEVGIACGDITLEAAAHLPDGEPRGAVVVCHPHPLYGGNMESHVVTTLARTLADNGLAALRFNFRGVGRSGGQHAQGLGEQQDVLAALEAARELGRPQAPVGLAGYSFGAVMAAAVMAAVMAESDAARAGALALISPPAAALPQAALARPDLPKLLMVGSEDPIASPAQLEELTLSWGESAELVVLPGIDHFWSDGFEGPAARISAWFLKMLGSDGPPYQ